MERPNYWPDSVQEVLAKLRRGDPIEITWLDASESSNVSTGSKISNHTVESVCRSVGFFHSVQKGASYADAHLLIVKDFMDTDRMRLQSVPLVLVKAIFEVHEIKHAMMMVGRRRAIIHFQDGSVKRIGV